MKSTKIIKVSKTIQDKIYLFIFIVLNQFFHHIVRNVGTSAFIKKYSIEIDKQLNQ